MKRGLITWDKAELPPSVFESRLSKARAALAERGLPALVIYTDVWRSREGRYFTNFMPYWNRSLIVIPADVSAHPILYCGLSPRVYPWIKSVTILEDIRPGLKIETGDWTKLGVLDLPHLPREIQLPLELIDVQLDLTDEFEADMDRRAEDMAREILAREMPNAAGLTDHQFAGRLERAYRRAGAEDLEVRFNGKPAHGAMLGKQDSISVDLEYRGHWARILP